MTRASSALKELAARYGIQSSYLAVDGSTRLADEEVVVALLAALGSGIEKRDDAPRALAARRLTDARRVIEPVLVQRVGRAATATVKLPDGVDPGSIEVTLDSGGGPVRLGRLLADAVRTGATDVDRRRYVAYGLDLDRLAGTPLEPGYYRLGLESGDEIASSLLLVASTCPLARRGWGAFIPVHALRSDKDWGVRQLYARCQRSAASWRVSAPRCSAVSRSTRRSTTPRPTRALTGR